MTQQDVSRDYLSQHKMGLAELYRKGARAMSELGLDYDMEGVEREYVLKRNQEIFQKYLLRQKVIGAEIASTRTKLLNVELSAPVMMSPITHPIRLITEDGLIKVARALKSTGSMMSLGGPIPPNLKEIVETGVPVLQTLKPLADRERLMRHIARVEEAGVTWFGIEVDASMGTRRGMGCSPVSVEELKEIKARVKRPFVLKGILSAWDAEKALEAGADVIFVSNHGGHTIDTLPHPLEMMDEIKSVIGDRIPIIADGGFRHGTDVLKALALGAQAVGLGRPILLALAAGGEEGVRSLVELITEELKKAMTLTGVKDPAKAHKGILIPVE
ncbi:MAG: alpha-hydroxy-acid oxidizing protein [Dehalococcoidia bacterium]|nr:alpha-hydroxy-acid oxidizing protein [Dehalococcoidia bacterium]